MYERYAALDRGKMCNSAQVHDFLYTAGAQHCETGLTACVNIGVITEDGKSVCGNGTCCYIDNARKQFTCYLVHVRDHEKEALRSGIRCCQSAGGQRPVERIRKLLLRLKFDNFYRIAEDVLLP